MNIYVESNFLLELVLRQEEWEACEELLLFCERGGANLVIPAFAFAEPVERLIRQEKDRYRLAESVASQLRELGRSHSYQSETEALKGITSLLTRSAAEEKLRFVDVRKRVLQVAEVVPLNIDNLLQAAAYESSLKLSPQDAIIFASILHHLSGHAAPAYFITRDRKDFSDAEIQDRLAQNGCKLIFGFSHGNNFIFHTLRTAQHPTQPD